MRDRQINSSWRPLASVVVVVAFVVVVRASGGDTGNHLLTAQEKASIVAAQGKNVQAGCQNIVSRDCRTLSGPGTVTSCGLGTYPNNCGGDCEPNYCKATNSSFACNDIDPGGFETCPTFQTLQATCNAKKTGGNCTGGVDVGCYCVQGSEVEGSNCGAVNAMPNPFPAKCDQS